MIPRLCPRPAVRPYAAAMGLKRECERCGAERRPVVEINERGVPHGAGPEHRQVHDYVRILECPGCGHGVLYSFSHDCYLQPWETDEPWDMDWTWRLEPEDLTRLRQGLADCPDPLSHLCRCPAHDVLRNERHAAVDQDEARVVLGEDGLPRLRRRTGHQ
ncbi:hypothetical protein B1H19_24565 [Streptomyces gilvosporeus]|uniref:Uncharacterized protein n=2 Tax=Streptomyces gilvosporeus TaxID=553510 RepID=A0A1V0TVL7_9ACTN|nr:hypothetical protein B1H19_24565 [Streptomyces gilvosporeus]